TQRLLGSSVSPSGRDEQQWVDRPVVNAHLEVQVRTGGIAGEANIPNNLSLGDGSAGGDGQPIGLVVEVRIEGRHVVIVPYQDHQAIRRQPVVGGRQPRILDHAVGCRHYRRVEPGADIYGIVSVLVWRAVAK